MVFDKKILVSIITPTLNRARFLEKNILSIKNQDYPFIEHIIVDGGSTDNTIEIIKKYEGTYNLKWISEKDRGYVDAMNKGFKMAKGDIFCWLDSDDFYFPGTIKKISKVFHEHPEVDVVFGDILLVDTNNKTIGYTKRTKFDYEALLYIGMILSPQATFWRSLFFKKLGGFDERYLRCADYNFFLKMANAGAKFYHLRDFLAAYRKHSQQLTKTSELLEYEREEISQKYINKNFTPRFLKWKKRKILVKRALEYIKQGDIWYVLRGMLKHFGIMDTDHE